MNELADRLARLSAEQRALFEWRRRHARDAEAGLRAPIPRRGVEPAPLSFAQQRLWFLGQLAPDSHFYNEPLLAIRLTGQLAPEKLEALLARIVARHESLRSRFPSADGVPGLVIAPSLPLPLARIDLRHLPADERERALTRFLKEESSRAFDLGRGPLLRVTLLRQGDDCHVLVVALHHIISDGWSLRILLRELASLDGSALPELPIQYGDYAAWQRRLLTGPLVDEQLAFWKQQLQEPLARLDLKPDRPRPARGDGSGYVGFHGAYVAFEIEPDVAAALRKLARDAGCTLYMVLLAAFQLLLYRRSGQTDIVLGTPVAGRSQRETEGVIGFFVNTLVLRTSLAGNPTVRQLIERARETALAAFAHEDVPFDRVVEHLQPRRDAADHPLFQVMFAHHNFGPSRHELPGLVIERIDYFTPVTKFDLVLVTDESEPERLTAQLEYATDRFDACTIESLAAELHDIMRAIPAALDARLHALARAPVAAATGQLAATAAEHGVSVAALLVASFQAVLVRLGRSAYAAVHVGLGERVVEAAGEPRAHDALIDVAIRADRCGDLATVAGQPLVLAPAGDEGEPALRLHCAHEGDTLHARLEEDPASNAVAGGAGLLEAFRAVVAEAASRPATVIRELPLVTPATLRQLTRDDAAPLLAMRIDARWQEQVRRQPDAPAIEHGERRWSYAELDRLANRLAWRLRRRGLGRDAIVACHLCPSAETSLAVLAVLKAGGAFVFTNPRDPAERTGVLLDSVRPALVITESRWLHTLPAREHPRLCLDPDDSGDGDNGRDEPPPPLGGPDDLAYLMFTSGTTAEPKVVMVAHRGVCTFVAALRRRPGVRVAQLNSFSFDAALGETFTALLSGGTLVVLDLFARPADDWTALLVRSRIDHLVAVPSLLRVLDPARVAALDALEVHSVGEPCPVELARAWSRACAFINAYGPAETTICSHLWRAPRAWSEARESVPIGEALPGVYAYVLDQYLQPLPAGITGELFLAGVGVARGYRGRPALTAERMLPDPFAAAPGARMYRSGDLVRLGADGLFEFVGRVDEQLKIRGMRVDPGEVEATLRLHPAAAEAVVGSVDGASLTAWVEPAPDVEAAALDAELLDGWSALTDQAGYDRAADEEFNTTGWKSSYTGEDVTAAEMEELVANATGRILALRPARVFELGCGTGLLLFRIAPRCREYWGSDFCGPAIDNICSRLSRPPWVGNIRLLHRRADDFSGLAGERFDTVIINSVIQYFPSAHYLRRVLAQAIERVDDGGAVFIGDVRHLGLLPAFHASVALRRAAANERTEKLQQTLARRLREEPELVVDPAFFTSWAREHPRVRGLTIAPKRGRLANELTRFRYDVTLFIGAKEAEPALDLPALDLSVLDGPAGADTIADVRRRLQERGPDRLVLRRVPNARVERERRALAAIEQLAAPTAAEVRRHVDGGATAGLDPEAFWALAEELSYDCEISWLDGGADGAYDVVLTRREGHRAPAPAALVAALPTRPLANRPARDKHDAHVAAALEAFARARLPPHMVPAEVRVVAALPRSPSGKIDRAALPALAAERPGAPAGTWARGALEQIIVDVWREVLGHGDFGFERSFFDVGGHSLKATQVIARLNRLCDCALPVRALFDAPTVEQLARLITAQRRPAPPAAVAIAARPERDRRPLSLGQRRLWFLEQLLPGTARYHVVFNVRLNGALDVAALASSLDEICRRHEVLRSRVAERDGVAAQLVDEDFTLALPLVALDERAPPERERELRRLELLEATSPFDLERGPLVRARLVRLAAHEHVLLCSMHHLVTDGWSLLVMARELSELYSARREGRRSSLRELALHYADYAAWQIAEPRRPALAGASAFWTKQLAGLGAVELPRDRPPPARPSFHAERVLSEVPRPLADALRALAGEAGATRFMLLMAAFQMLLFRFTGQTDIAVGSPVANREHKQLEELIGFFVNTLVFRCDLSGNPGFAELLARMRSTALDAYDHQEMPFELLVELLRPERDLSRAPLIQVWFSYFDVDGDLLRLTGLEAELLEVPYAAAAEFDLALSVRETERGLACAWIYSAELFDRDTVQRLADAFTTLLASAVAEPRRPIATLPLLPPERARELLRQGRGPDLAGAGARVHQRFEAQARHTPEAPAISFNGQTWSYGEVNARANRLARHLASLPLGRQALVGLCLPPGIELATAVLAVLKAGGAYVPLDPAYPEEHLGRMVARAGLSTILTSAGLDALAAALARQPDGNLDLDGDGADLAYVIFTSGSTGQPKGVAVRHESVVNVVASLAEVIGVGAETVALASTALSFDIAALELFLPLFVGGRVVIADRATASDGEALAALIADARVTLVQATPTAFRLLVACGFGGGAGLTLLSGGETLPRDLADALCRRCARLVNLYGPTETTIWSSYADIDDDGTAIAIGRPLANTRLYVLDARQQLVPSGVAGELYIGGLGVADGYLADAAQTAARFLPDPFAGIPGARMFRSGDRARQRHDGRLVHLGRVDRQVKVRGFRVELDEVQHLLAQHPGVRQAVVVAEPDGDGGTRLVAYWTGAPDGEPTALELQQHVRARLPGFMVPAACVRVAAMPTTPGGKTDLRSLSTVAPPASGPVGRGSATERAMRQLWAEALGLDTASLGPNDDFFADLGGHSVLALRIVSRVRRAFRVKLPLRALFEAPRLVAFAAVVDAASKVSPIEPRVMAGAERAALTPAQARLRSALAHGRWSSDNRAIGIELVAPLDRGRLERGLAALVRRHQALRVVLDVDGNGAWQRVVEAAPVTLTHGRARAPELWPTLRDCARVAIDVRTAPGLRAHHLVLDDGREWLILVVPRLFADEPSLSTLAQELLSSYAAGAEPSLREPPLPELCYLDCLAWLNAWHDHAGHDEQRAARAQALAHLDTPLLDMPSLATPSPATPPLIVRSQWAIPAAQTAALRHFADAQAADLAGLADLALAALLWSLRRPGRERMAISVRLPRRDWPGMEHVVGPLTQDRVLLADVAGVTTARALLERTRAASADAFLHRDLAPDAPLDAAIVLRIDAASASPPPLSTGTYLVDALPAGVALMATVSLAGDELRGDLEYDARTGDASWLADMPARITRVLTSAALDPDGLLNAFVAR